MCCEYMKVTARIAQGFFIFITIRKHNRWIYAD